MSYYLLNGKTQSLYLENNKCIKFCMNLLQFCLNILRDKKYVFQIKKGKFISAQYP